MYLFIFVSLDQLIFFVLSTHEISLDKGFMLIVFLFISTVFEENVEVLSYPWHRRRRRRLRRRGANTLTFSNISEDIYLKLRIVVHYQKGNPYQSGR